MSGEIWSRTAPCLLLDLLDYNFQGSFADIFILASPKGLCQHVFTTNEDRTSLPQHWDERPDQSTTWALALTCQLCRAHVDIKIEFGDCQLACPSRESPLHHFCFSPVSSPLNDAYPRHYRLRCSFKSCQARLWAVLRLPEIQPNEVEFLLNVDLRMKAAMEHSPKVRKRNALEVLGVFRTYINDCLNDTPKNIPMENGSFYSCLGVGASKMLLRLGFTPVEEEDHKHAWMPPQPSPHGKADLTFDLARCALEDVREELTALIQARPEPEKEANISDMYPPPPGAGRRNLERLLGASEYAKAPQTTNQDQAEIPELYSGLGALLDYSDPLIAWCYDQQCRSDASRIPFFFRCLKRIAEVRQSEELTTKALTLESQGLRTDIEIAEAFEVIGIDSSHLNLLNDENILSKYRSRFQDSGTDERRRMRHALATIGDYKQSPLIADAAKGTIDTYEQALEYIGAYASTADEFVLALKAAKEKEPLADKSTVFRAVEIIAAARNSAMLLAHLQDEDESVPKMDINTAYNVFSAFPTADSDTLTLAFPELLHDNPGRRDEIIRAMKTIAEARSNNELLQQAESALQAKDGQSHIQATPLSYPRGLENIGNTCYLNSFLQYLFTIKPLRQMIQDIDNHQQESSDLALSSKRVGDEQVTRHQVLRAQNFVHELGNLFEALRSVRSRAVTLERSLAALTVAPTGDWTAIREQEKRRRSTMVGAKAPNISPTTQFANEMSESPYSAVSTAVVIESPQEEVQFIQSIDEAVFAKIDDHNNEIESHPKAMDNGPATEIQAAMDVDASNPDPLPRGEDIENPDNLDRKQLIEPTSGSEATASLAQPTQEPPPVPPRRAIEDSKQFKDASTEKIEEWARQQDMREALANVFRQLRWAVRTEADSNGGEQVDLVSRLFYGKENIVTLKENGEKVAETIPFHSLYVIPDESYENIYGMLDGAYGFRDIADESSQERRSQYSTFSNVPPVLHIDVAVTAWDKEAQHAVRRAPFKVAESFYMDRYLDNPASIETRKRVSELMSKLSLSKDLRTRLTKSELGIDLPSALRNAGVYLGELSKHAEMIGLDAGMIPTSLVKDIHDLEEETSHQLSLVNGDIEQATHELSKLFPEQGDLLYQLHAVCTHTGRADSGHYFIYIYDPEERRWYKFNDETVELVDNTQAILDPNGGIRDGIPAMLVYVRESERSSLIQTVCRQEEDSIEDLDSSNQRLPSNPNLAPGSLRPDWDVGRDDLVDDRNVW